MFTSTQARLWLRNCFESKNKPQNEHRNDKILRFLSFDNDICELLFWIAHSRGFVPAGWSTHLIHCFFVFNLIRWLLKIWFQCILISCQHSLSSATALKIRSSFFRMKIVLILSTYFGFLFVSNKNIVIFQFSGAMTNFILMMSRQPMHKICALMKNPYHFKASNGIQANKRNSELINSLLTIPKTINDVGK